MGTGTPRERTEFFSRALFYKTGRAGVFFQGEWRRGWGQRAHKGMPFFFAKEPGKTTDGEQGEGEGGFFLGKPFGEGGTEKGGERFF